MPRRAGGVVVAGETLLRIDYVVAKTRPHRRPTVNVCGNVMAVSYLDKAVRAGAGVAAGKENRK